MPILKSSIKQVRKVKKQTLLNKVRRSQYKSVLKKINILIKNKDKKVSSKLLSEFNSQIFKAAKKGSVSKKTAARQVSRITKKINSINVK